MNGKPEIGSMKAATRLKPLVTLGRQLLGSLMAFPLLLNSSVTADRASMTVDLSRPGQKVSPLLYGLFFEEINHAGDGGLYAELVSNRSFEDADTAEGWAPVTSGGGEVSLSLDTERPLNSQNPHALQLVIRSPDHGRAGVANGGYWGLSVGRAKSYVLTFHARNSEGFAGPLMVSLESAAGQVYAERSLSGVTTDWKRLSATLTCTRSDPSARLVLAATRSGTLWLDTVSLVPKNTFRKRANGLRADTARRLADMKPSFVRFPGGCFVEGDQLKDAYRWKNTIGDLAERPGHWNLWGYRSSDGLGYHEYLQMCDDLGAEPLFVVNCGMAHGGNVPMEQMDGWVQDALDAIEYANGPATTKWGALRAKHGHPSPFHLKYMEIGNENGGPAYEERYALFHDAIKKRYPDVQLIANVRVSSRPMDILDEHYYSSPEWFASQVHRYDGYDRNGPKIYVGEYACTQNCGQGNLRAALGEAAFMTGMERNAEVVVMASYAPLFVNANNRAWNPDAIVFDSKACYGTPSYHVQKLFSLNRNEVALPTQLQCETRLPSTGGAIGLGTWRTQAEFKDLRVTHGDEVLYSSDFSNNAAGWRVIHGDWKVEDGTYRQSSNDIDVRAVAGDPSWSDYTYALRARKLGGDEGFLLLFKVKDDNNWLWWNLGGWGNQRHAIEKSVNGGKSILGPEVPGRIETGRWYDLRIELQGERLRCYLDGQLIHDVKDASPQPMAVVAGLAKGRKEVILKVVNLSNVSQDTEINLSGAGKVSPTGTAIVLTANSPDDENTFSQPTRVMPVTLRVKGVAARFRYTFLPISLTVLRVGVK